MARKIAPRRHVKFSFLWGVAAVVLCSILGGCYGGHYAKVFVDKVRHHYAGHSWHTKTVHASLSKTDKAYTDRYVSPPAPFFKMSSK
jgi:hypothetical protein